MEKNLLILNEKIPWMGKYSGYGILFDYFKKKNINNMGCINIDRHNKSKYLPFLIRPLLQSGKKYTNHYDSSLFKGELNLFIKLFLKKYDLLHITFLERNFGYLSEYRSKFNIKLVSTAHQPRSWWEERGKNPDIVSNLDQLITMSTDQLRYFEEFLPGKVSFIPHAVNTDFFIPDEDKRNYSNPGCVFCGTWLRDLKTLEHIINKVLHINNKVRFDIIIPNVEKNKEIDLIRRISSKKEVHLHTSLSNHELLNIYQRSSILLLPILDATANNALLEAMSCGLPVISNRVGGISDYTDSSFADLHEVGDVDSFVESIFKIIDDKTVMKKRSISARKYAKENLGLEVIFNKTLELYNNLL